MLEPETEDRLERIENIIREIRDRVGTNWRWELWLGMWRGIGHTLGLILILLLLGWILNVIGVIPAFTAQVMEIKQILQNLKAR